MKNKIKKKLTHRFKGGLAFLKILFCSRNRDESKKGNKDERLSRHFGRRPKSCRLTSSFHLFLMLIKQ
jgi:hypothetical protein